MTPSTWLPDASHYPEQMTPLSATVWFEAIGLGLHEAMRELRGPFGGFLTRTEGGWAYEGELAPDWEPEPERLQAAALGLPERWERELLPRVEAINAELQRLRPELPGPAEAQALLDRLWELVREEWTIHFLAVIPAQVAAELLHDRYVELFGDEDPLASYRLLEGFEHPVDVAVRELAQRAYDLDVASLICDFEPAHALERLRALHVGRVWLHELDALLLRFGGRARWHELSLPREAELPQLTLESVRLLLERGEGARPHVAAPVPPAELAELFAQVRPAYALKELHTYAIDYPGLLATREALLGFGRRLAAEGLLADAADVWMLTRGELRDALVDDGDLRVLVQQRRDELAAARAAGPKAYLGEPPSGVDRHAALEKFYGAGGAALHGAGASPGVVEGIARVVAGPEDFARIRAGDILVTTMTTPAWTPLFGSVAGLVTDTGGVLSHAAVVAREYRIPAVVGSDGATRTIPDGGRIRIDGTTGEIVVL